MVDIIKTEIRTGTGFQICASAEAQAVKYTVHKDKSGKRWLVGDVPNKAEYVYVEGGPNSDGFGGRVITFPLVEGGELPLKGPWHSNSSDLFKATGIDVRGMSYSMCCIGLDRRFEGDCTYVTDVIYMEPEPLLGPDRPNVRAIAEAFADELGHSVFLDVRTRGGGSNGSVDPVNPATGKRYPYVAPQK